MEKRKLLKRKNKGKQNNIIIILTIIISIILALIVFFLFKLNNKKVEVKVEPKDDIKVYSLRLSMAGDNLIHSSIYNEANRNMNYNGYDFKPMYKYLKELVSDSELAYYNQETILGGSSIGVSTYPSFNSPYEVGDAMLDMGFNIISLANNHTLDRGEVAIRNSLNYWKDKDVLTAGSYGSMEERNEVRIKKKNNISYTLLSYTYGTNGIPTPKGKEYLVNIWPTKGNNPNTDSEYQEYKKIVKEDIERVRDKVDVLMVAMHWGVEYTHTPTAYQLDMAKFLSENDVDIVIGAHPHAIMPVTYIDDTLVIYSLGNLLSAQETNFDYMKMVGLLTKLDITKTIKNGKSNITFDNVVNELLFTSYTNWSNYKVVPFSHPDSVKYIPERERLYDKYSAIVKKIDPNMVVAPLYREG